VIVVTELERGSFLVDGMTVNDALMVVMYKQSQDDDENGSKKNEASTTSPKSGEKLNGKSSIKADLQVSISSINILLEPLQFH